VEFMNGFIIFPNEESTRIFLESPELAKFHNQNKLIKSSDDRVIIYNNFSPEDLSNVQNVAQRHGGDIKESTQYYPLSHV
jgi:hypothetical protein